MSSMVSLSNNVIITSSLRNLSEMGEYTNAPESGDSKPKLKPTWPPRSLLESLESAGFSSKTVNNSRRLSTGLLLLTLLFEEAKMDCVKEIDNIELITSVLDLLAVSKILIDIQSQNTLSTPNWEFPIGALPIPKWISSALLLIDLYQKTTISDARTGQKYLILRIESLSNKILGTIIHFRKSRYITSKVNFQGF